MLVSGGGGREGGSQGLRLRRAWGWRCRAGEVWKAVLLAEPGSEMGLTPLVFSLDAHPNEVTTHCRGQGAGLAVSHLVSFGFWGLAPLTDTWKPALSL